jgi:antitoxin component YwqK of YwqJK toxin-antitoxin module
MKPKFVLFIFILFILNSFQMKAGSVCSLQSDPLNGPKKVYYQNGKLMKEYTLKDGKIEGSYRTYDMLGRLVSDQYCKGGIPDGSLKTYYPGGQLKSEGFVRADGDISGPTREYFENGNIKTEGMISGKFPNISTQTKIYSEDGKLRSESRTSNGELEYAITYDQEGRVTSEQKPGQIISYWYENVTGKKHTSINGVEQK